MIDALKNPESRSRESIVVQRMDQPTRGSFLEQVDMFKPHAIHFKGHAKFDISVNSVKNSAYLAYVKHDDANTDWIEYRSFMDSFVDYPPRLNFLEGNDSKSIEGFNYFVSQPYLDVIL
ncbi:MAG TPA: hypothetical protein VFI70_02340 [Nitrososphaeraceae archaeon]|nr:hypothetical protein [Nitrososphaeraceae archaeon]